jgi:hypothetical protein
MEFLMFILFFFLALVLIAWLSPAFKVELKNFGNKIAGLGKQVEAKAATTVKVIEREVGIASGVLTELRALEAGGKLEAGKTAEYIDAHIALLKAKALSLVKGVEAKL